MSESQRRRAALIGLIVPVLGLAPVWATSSGDEGHADQYTASGSSAITDPTGDTTDDEDAAISQPPRADITAAAGELAGGNYTFRYSAADSVDPRSDPNWGSGDSFTDFMLDTNGDGEPDFDAEYGVDEGALYLTVYVYNDTDDPPEACTGTAGFEGGFYTATFPATCIGGPAAVGYQVMTQLDTTPSDEDGSTAAYDNAPEDSMAGPI